MAIPKSSQPSRQQKFSDTEENRGHFRKVLELYAAMCYQPMLTFASDLKQRGYHTSILTNNNELLFNEDGLVAIEDITVSSHHIHVSKPDAEAYRIFLEKIGSPEPAAVLFTDDKEKNVKAAIEAGIRGYLFRGRELPADLAFVDFVLHLKQSGLGVQEPEAYL